MGSTALARWLPLGISVLWPFVGQTLRNRGLSGLFFFLLCAHMPRASQASRPHILFHCGFHTGLAPMGNAARGVCFPWDFSNTCHIAPEWEICDGVWVACVCAPSFPWLVPIYQRKPWLHEVWTPFRDSPCVLQWDPSPKRCYLSKGKSCAFNICHHLFFPQFYLAWLSQREWDMFDSILFFFLFFKSQMLRQFTLIKLQLALKLSCINFSSIYREQDRWFKLHAIWGNARDICYRVNCLKLRLLSPFRERKTFALMLTELGNRISCSNGVCADFHPLLLPFALLQGLASQECSAAPVTGVPAALCEMQRQSVRGIPGQGSPQILWRTEPGGSRVWFCANKQPSSSPR